MGKTKKSLPETKPLQVYKHPFFKTIPARLDCLRGVSACIAVHSSYKDEAVCEEIKTCEANLNATHLAVEAGNRTLLPQRNDAVIKADEVLYDFVHLAERKGRKDPSALYNIGLDALMISSNKKSTIAVPGTAPSFQVVNAPHFGQMLGSVATMPGVRSWELWMTDNPNDESSWKYYQTFFKSSNMLITGLESGKVYYFRIRGLNSAGATPWSVVVCLRAL